MTKLEEAGRERVFRTLSKEKIRKNHIIVLISALFIILVGVTSYLFFYQSPSSEKIEKRSIPTGGAIIGAKDFNKTSTTISITTTTSTSSTTTTTTTSTTTSTSSTTSTILTTTTIKSVREMASCLSSQGVTIYIKENCYWCDLIENYFGVSYNLLNAIDCDSWRNREECEDMLDEAEGQGKERGYPTWEVYNELYPGASIREILSLTNCG